MASIYDFEMNDIQGESVSLGDYRGEVLLVVNVASQCGLTPQYAGLKTIHEQFDGFEVLGFPCNQFGAQEPGSDAEICEFAESRYGIDFPMFSKIEVNGDGAAPLYQWLKQEQPGDGDSSDITWNFEKFLIDRDGNVARRFSPRTTPEEVAEVIPQYL
jgi:glutathione peroxidase